jgi:hypothetical protein
MNYAALPADAVTEHDVIVGVGPPGVVIVAVPEEADAILAILTHFPETEITSCDT